MDELSSRYQIHRHRFGWLVFGAVPVSELATLMRLVPGQEDVHDQRIADYYQATLAICSVADSHEWRRLLWGNDATH